MEGPNTDDITVTLNSFTEGDTINIDRRMYYTINALPEQFGFATEVLLDNKRISSNSQSNSGEFTVQPSFYEDGEHTIRIVHELSSGTGSIAEQLQMERITVFKDFKFIIKREPSQPPSITSVITENGSIRVSWENRGDLDYKDAYLSIQFPEYESRIPITEEFLDQENYIDTYTVLFPLDTNRPEREDRSNVTYSIIFTSEYVELIGEGSTLQHDPSWITITMSFVDIEHYRLTWPQHPLYANFGSYEVYLRTDWSSEAYNFSASTQGGSELVDAPYSFGADYFGSLFPETDYDPYIPSYNFKPILDEASFGLIPNIDQYFGQNFIFNPSTQRYYLIAAESNAVGSNQGISIFEYSQDFNLINKTVLYHRGSLNQVNALGFELDPISNNFYLEIIHRGDDFQLVYETMELDKNNLSTIRAYAAENKTSFQLRGKILKTWDYQTKTLTLTNTETNEVFYTYYNQDNNSVTISYLSNDGKYIFIRQGDDYAIYEITNNTLIRRASLPESPGYSFSTKRYSLDIYNDTLYYATANNTIEVIDLLSGQTLTTIPYSAGNNNRSVSYDPISNNLLLVQGELGFLADISTNELSSFSYESDKGNSGLGSDYYLWLTNGKLIHSKGIYVDIE
ncbi:hypothetical protein LCGC14_0128880 [marine sediment metagenome]|uniref:Uncharacterized protein n=1 Tax=marine sediment metagenome TaxID=412755 RepID=A0A0F9XLB5_9ZZZZ|nr:hypothetical protein [Maribacter sp.]HDZ06142.1 hypothetical protein [Maribacter sp.]